ncbi:galactose oxidase [Wolfiporia cocos MD-104 SS10]|uniref:Galactose oxidase n=1 Tax=Wolfiporia cocos (strain MD-104) TaxID=742152 RepID=A0A2H3JEK8_WOLCO|nr:galactose oxidase [Wolfiporia cocos MD-104 SS10]
MAKKKSGKDNTKAAAKAAKKAKAAQKVERKEKKKATKSKEEEDDEDLESILDKIKREWEEAHRVTEELVEGPPSRRANATFTPCPSGNYLWCIGGEFFSDDGKAYFYNDVFRYSPEKDEWRKFVSPTCPGPRSAHAVVASPAGGGKLYLFGGEFSSLYQNSFHHYRDLWCFDISTHSWDRIETKVKPTARSGHRMAMWKHYVVLFGGFYDPGLKTHYLNDLWLFDTQEYKWRQVEMKDAERKPSWYTSPRLVDQCNAVFALRTPPMWTACLTTKSCAGGYCKEYKKGSRPVGVMLDDTWFLRYVASFHKIMKSVSKNSFQDDETPTIKWERRKRPSTAFAPSIRSGCTMSLWLAKNMGILFGGVTDEDTNEETLESTFHNDLYGYQIAGNGRWISMMLKQAKKKAGGGKKQKAAVAPIRAPSEDEMDDDGSDAERSSDDQDARKAVKQQAAPKAPAAEEEVDPDDPELTKPVPRYNAMLAVLRNTLYIYGGIFERGSREYTLDDFYALQLDKMERYTCLKHSGITITEGSDESSDEGDDEDDSDDEDGEGGDGDETPPTPSVQDDTAVRIQEDDKDKEAGEDTETEKDMTQAEKARDVLSSKATAFMGVVKDSTRSAEDVISTPLPGEALAMFYARSREYWTQKAHGGSGNRGKELRRDAFALAKEKYATYKPILQEVEKVLAEAGLDEEEMRKGAAAGGSDAGSQRRNRR